MLTRVVAALVLLGTAPPAVMAQPILLGQIDTFQDGSTNNWTNGPLFPDPVNVPNGGPQGVGDRFLQVTSGGLGNPPRITTFNVTQWTGNYISAGVTQVEMDLRNFTGSALQMRWALRQVNGNQFTPGYVSTVPFNLPPDGQWHHAVFLLDTASLTPINNPAPLSTFLTTVGEGRMLHSVTPSLLGEAGSFQFGVDNILAAGAAVPEPTTWAMMVCSGACVGWWWSRRKARPMVEQSEAVEAVVT
jgi:hypothetical protein